MSGERTFQNVYVNEREVQYDSTATPIILDHPWPFFLPLNSLRQFSVLGDFSKRDDIRRRDLIGEADSLGRETCLEVMVRPYCSASALLFPRLPRF